jgi:hypothetical protein
MNEDEPYIDRAGFNAKDLDDGTLMPERLIFTDAEYNSQERTFVGKIDFGETTVSYPENEKP